MNLAPKLAALTIFVLPLYLIKFNFFQLSFNLLDFLALLSIGCWFWENNQQSFFALFKRNRAFFWASSALFGGLLLSFVSNQPSLHGLGIVGSWFLIPFLFTFLFFSQNQSKQTVRFLTLNLYLSIFIVSLVALLYKFTNNLTYDGRLAAFYDSPNYLAMFLAPGLFLGFYLFFPAQNKTFSSKKTIFLFLLSLIPILSALYFTFSYATWTASGIALFALGFFSRKKTNKPFLFLIALSFLILSFFLIQFPSVKMQSLLQENPRSSWASRQMIWQSSSKILRDHLIFGIGPGNFQQNYLAYQKYFPPYLEWAVPQPHNIYLAFWLQTGFLGLAGFLLLLFFLFQNKNASLALWSFFVYLVLHGMFDTPYWKNDLAYLFWLFAFLLLWEKKSISTKNQSDTKSH